MTVERVSAGKMQKGHIGHYRYTPSFGWDRFVGTIPKFTYHSAQAFGSVTEKMGPFHLAED